jgi:hypothetical protein
MCVVLLPWMDPLETEVEQVQQHQRCGVPPSFIVGWASCVLYFYHGLIQASFELYFYHGLIQSALELNVSIGAETIFLKTFITTGCSQLRGIFDDACCVSISAPK